MQIQRLDGRYHCVEFGGNKCTSFSRCFVRKQIKRYYSNQMNDRDDSIYEFVFIAETDHKKNEKNKVCSK